MIIPIVSGPGLFPILFASVEEFFEFQMDVLTGKKTRDAAHATFMDKMVRDELAFAGNGKYILPNRRGILWPLLIV